MDAKEINGCPDVDTKTAPNGFEIAVIGMAGRFPGASSIDMFWDNLRDGVESIATFSDEEILNSGISRATLDSPNFVKAAGILDRAEWFDAAFFKCSQREARIMDPQHRVFLECSYEALQHAGYDPHRYRGAVGVFAGASTETYQKMATSGDADQVDVIDGLQNYIGNDRNFLSTRVSYKLNLKGPSLTIQTACSTSLVAVHMAYQSLLGGECDIALAGGVSIRFPQKVGYLYQKEGILSPDGHCRAFDAAAEGTVGGEGVGIVVLKRLADALADGDCIHAVIKGSAMNNDGSRKLGFTAPSVEGQADAIARAQAMADVEPDSVGYIETHGTGTQLGDPIEIAALTRAFRSRGSERQHFCAIGAVKTNIGHLDAAAGIAGLIKTILVLKKRQIPPSLHYQQANPKIEFAQGPFYVNDRLTDWNCDNSPFYAGVSSFGIGGSNVHMVLEEAPRLKSTGEVSSGPQLVLLSAASATALDKTGDDLVAHLKVNPELALTDIAFTLQTGRQQFRHRRMLVCDDLDDAIAALESRDQKRVIDTVCKIRNRPVVFMFPGQGSQYEEMGKGLYQREPEFRQQFDECCELLKPQLDLDLRNLLFSIQQDENSATQQINQTSLTQPALFALEYSLARLLISRGVQPAAMIGHSIGEYVAACLAGVFSLPDALSLVCARARMMQTMNAGSMLAIPMSAVQVEKLLGEGLSLAAINDPSLCVVSGLTLRVEELQADLATQGIEATRLHTSHAFHSEMMEPILKPFEDLVRETSISKPGIPYISNLTGKWITAEEVSNPAYWSQHLRSTVQFAAGLDHLFQDPSRVFLEVGPGQTLASLVRRNPSKGSDHLVISSMRHPNNKLPDDNLLMNSLGRLWLAGIEIKWPKFVGDEVRQKIPLPSYPFQRQRFWIDQKPQQVQAQPAAIATSKISDSGQWFYAPGWKSTLAPWVRDSAQPRDGCWLVFSDGGGLCQHFIGLLRAQGRDVTVVVPGSDFNSLESGEFTLRPGHRADMAALLAQLKTSAKLPRNIVHLWSGAGMESTAIAANDLDGSLASGFYSLLHLAQTLAEYPSSDSVELIVVGRGTQSVTGAEVLCPENAVATGLCHVIPQEQDRIRCRTIDVEVPNETSDPQRSAKHLLAEVSSSAIDPVVALRNSGRWTQVFEPVYLNEAQQPDSHLRHQGVYLITGGFGNIGLHLAHYLAQAVCARLVLIGRSEVPARDSWDAELAAQGEDSKVGRKIIALRALEQAGAEVVALSADVTDETQMRKAVDQVVDRYGQINGVIHAATTNDQRSFQLLRDLDQETCELQFAAKIRGLQVLDRVLQGQTPDFCMLMSSLASLLGGLRFAAYASANAYLDTFAQGQGGLPWFSVNWDGWQFGGASASDKSAVARRAMLPEEGVAAFARLLGVSAAARMAVSTWDLQARREQWSISLQKAVGGAVESGDAANAKQQATEPAAIDMSREGIERRLCEIWSELLGVDGVGVDDNYFDLGGDSLLALQVTSRLREGLLADLSAASVLEAPTVAELTQHILQQQQAMRSGSDKAAELLQQIKNKTPEERGKLLAEARKARSVSK